jgi:hypothetical protein
VRLFDADTVPDDGPFDRCAACGEIPENPQARGGVIFCAECMDRTREWSLFPIRDTLGGSE